MLSTFGHLKKIIMKILRLFSVVSLLLFQTALAGAFAQKAGEVISGIVYDSNGPMMKVEVTERDGAGNSVAHSITNDEGIFSFKLVDPNDSIIVTYVGYEPVIVPIDVPYIGIMMKGNAQTANTGRVVDGHPKSSGVIGSESYTMEQLQKYAPHDYVCGYVMKDPYGTFIDGFFLVKEKNKYNLVYKKLDKTENRSIKSNIAKNLESSIHKSFEHAESPQSASVQEYSGAFISFYDGYTAYAVTPDKAVYFWTNMSANIPDDLWMEELLKLKKGI